MDATEQQILSLSKTYAKSPVTDGWKCLSMDNYIIDTHAKTKAGLPPLSYGAIGYCLDNLIKSAVLDVFFRQQYFAKNEYRKDVFGNKIVQVLFIVDADGRPYRLDDWIDKGQLNDEYMPDRTLTYEEAWGYGARNFVDAVAETYFNGKHKLYVVFRE